MGLPEGIVARVKVIKSKVGNPFREAIFNIIFGSGIDWADDLLTVATNKDLIEKSGAWYTINGERVQGSAKAAEYLKEHPDVAKELREKALS